MATTRNYNGATAAVAQSVRAFASHEEDRVFVSQPRQTQVAERSATDVIVTAAYR